MKTEEFAFKLDPKVVPQEPIELRGKSRDDGRMIVLDRSEEKIDHTVVSTICDYLRPGDLLVLNDSYVCLNTLQFQNGSESVEVTVYGYEPDGTSLVGIRGEKLSVKPELVLTSTNDDRLTLTMLQMQPDKVWKARFEPSELLVPTLEQHGQVLDGPSVIQNTHWKAAPQAYRSVYAKKPGSLQIPSAGLHFSSDRLAQATSKGVEIAYITLHVGTAEAIVHREISEEEIEKHKVRSEYFEVGEEAAAQISKAKAEGRRVIAIGTTVMRTLESLTIDKKLGATIQAQSKWTDLYIYPGFNFKVVDGLLTSLHGPRSSHLVLTTAFAGKDFGMRGYKEITEKGIYEFDLFGDCMLIL
ncbi:S-adenosylmethionine:tRNA ribosyltransferase-isomerase [Cladobotryum mycophilum]|uniref:S-adenosylmethionine:tRNA ribosyltransferase-isomerase n=1 Tax=Cladobotryum mycophilum TaxID=491253 RepID=A0ABR0SRJ5_9HYPO